MREMRGVMARGIVGALSFCLLLLLFAAPASAQATATLLGTVSDAESVAHLRALYDRASNDRLREALVEGVAIHDTESLVLPFLQQVLDGNASTDVREEAAEGLGFHDGNDSLRMLVTLARGDRSPEVRREAAEAMGMLRRPDAADTLVALAGTARDIEVRLEATEALGASPRIRATPDPTQHLRQQAQFYERLVTLLGLLP